jgi:hypothetical protein
MSENYWAVYEDNKITFMNEDKVSALNASTKLKMDKALKELKIDPDTFYKKLDSYKEITVKKIKISATEE